MKIASDAPTASPAGFAARFPLSAFGRSFRIPRSSSPTGARHGRAGPSPSFSTRVRQSDERISRAQRPHSPSSPPGPKSRTATSLPVADHPLAPSDIRAWADVPDHEWDSTGTGSLRTPSGNARQLAELLSFSPEERAALDRADDPVQAGDPPLLLLAHRPRTTPATRSASRPSPRRWNCSGAVGTEEDDPLDEDKDSPVPGLTHRYPDRALMVTTHVCTMYCRFCTRKRATMKRGGWDSVSRDDRRMVEYVRDHPEIRDVIVSGGDPLTLPPREARLLRREPVGDRPPRRDPDRHPGPGHAAPAPLRRRRDRGPVGVGQDLDPDPLQPPPRGHPGGRPGLQAAADGRDADQQPRGAAPGRQRQPEPRRRNSAGPSCGSRSGPTTCSTATRSPAPATSGPRSGRGSRSSKGSAGTSPAWACRPTSSTPPEGAARSP